MNNILFVFDYSRLWKIDGSSNKATILAENIENPGGTLTISSGFHPRDIKIKDNELYFRVWTYADPTDTVNNGAGYGATISQWWKSDGTRLGTLMLYDSDDNLDPNFIEFIDFFDGLDKLNTESFIESNEGYLNGLRYFFNFDEVTNTEGIWQSDLMGQNSRLFRQTNTTSYYYPSSFITFITFITFINFGDKLYFNESIGSSLSSYLWIITDNNIYPPIANNDSYDLNKNSVFSIASSGILNNDTDLDEDPLTAVLISNVSNGNFRLFQ